MTDRLTYTTSEVAEALGCSPDHVRDLVARGDLPSLPRGHAGLILVPVVALERYVERAVQGSAA